MEEKLVLGKVGRVQACVCVCIQERERERERGTERVMQGTREKEAVRACGCLGKLGQT